MNHHLSQHSHLGRYASLYSIALAAMLLCLSGCAIGESVGMALGAGLNWGNAHPCGG